MSRKNIIRAWRDPEYRKRLSARQRALIPDNPAGFIELNDSDLALVGGAGEPTTDTNCPSACQGGTCTCLTCTTYCTCETCDTHCGTCDTFCGTCGTVCTCSGAPCCAF
jgi:mersacidin/lichenicidin family type 2 lantibiotic